jgi:single-stranded DNA-binding protein
MSARAIVSGVLHKAPETKVSKNGNSYARATIRDGKGDDANWWACLIFNASAVEEVQRLEPGDPIAVAGEIKADIYTPPGKKPRINLTIIGDTLLSARRSPRSAKQKTTETRDASSERAQWDRGGAPIDDNIPC